MKLIPANPVKYPHKDEEQMDDLPEGLADIIRDLTGRSSIVKNIFVHHNLHKFSAIVMMPQPEFLPLSNLEKNDLGIRQFDIILVTGDAYVDHPSFGTGLIGRVLWDAGFTVGIIAQPDWKTSVDFTELGQPRLFFGISSGNVDSMVNNFTPNLKRRSDDVYSPGGIPKRPDRATIVYTNRVHELFPDTPIVLGGIEASLRRFAQYDYWQDKVRQAILADAPADLLVFGMGERQVVEIALRLAAGETVALTAGYPGNCVQDGDSRVVQ